MSVPTANVLVTNNRKALDDILLKMSSGGKVYNLVNELTDNDDLALFSNQANPYFISFKHSFSQENPLITMEFLDPEGDFEQRFLSNRSIYESLFSVLRGSVGNQLENLVYKKRQLEVKRSLLGLTSQQLSQAIKERLDRAEAEKYFYIAYGVGDNIKYWSNVHKVKIYSITYDVKGTRRFTVEFASIDSPLSKSYRRGILGNQVDLDTVGLDTVCEGYSQRLRFNEYLQDKSPIYSAQQNPFIQEVDYHLLVCDVVRDYLKNATKGANVIVAMPDLNKLIGPTMAKINLYLSKKPAAPASPEQKTSNLLQELKMELVSETTDLYQKIEQVPDEIRGLVQQTRYGSNLVNRAVGVYSERDFFARLSSKEGKGAPDQKTVLREVFNNINKLSSNYKINFSLLLESDQNIIDYWASLGDLWVLNGYEPFDPTQPTVIVGDRTFISEVLFGQSKPQIPIYELDKEVYLNESYLQAISEVSKKISLPSSYVLGNLYQVPDEFAYTDEELIEKAKKAQEEFAVPVFKYNTENPNVLSIKDTFQQGVYLSNLKSSFQKLRGSITKSISEGGVPVQVADFPITTLEALFDSLLLSKYSSNGAIMGQQEILEKIANNISPEIAFELYKNGSTLSMVKYIAAASNEMNRQIRGNTILVPDYYDKAPPEIMADLITRTVSAARQVYIESLPFFNISNTSFINSPCMVFAQDAPILGQSRVSRTAFNTYLTGAYKIMGYTHFISPNNVSSKFTLVKPQGDIKEQEEKIIPPPSDGAPDNTIVETVVVNSTPEESKATPVNHPPVNRPSQTANIEGIDWYTPPTQEQQEAINSGFER